MMEPWVGRRERWRGCSASRSPSGWRRAARAAGSPTAPAGPAGPRSPRRPAPPATPPAPETGGSPATTPAPTASTPRSATRSWTPCTTTWTSPGTPVATEDAPRIPLDFTGRLSITALTVDGSPASHTVEGDDLLIDHPVTADEEYRLVLEYDGTPAPTEAPSRRRDFADGLGWHVTDEHETWTLQEPYGAFTWYAVNDHPSDKALYDFTLRVPEPWSGVANGVLTSSTAREGQRINRWHLAEPASSYLITASFGDFQHTDLTSSSGVPIQIWADADDDPMPGETSYAPKAIDWLERILGPYPFDSFGLLIVDNESGMETQTMVTLGDTRYSLSAEVVVHEAAHHWYGDTVTPADWSDVWMNEGMAMYLQGMWEAEQEGIPVAEKMDDWAEFEPDLRAAAGPPGAFDPARFGDANIYYGPALMWHELRERLGDDRFFEVLREWPAERANTTASRAEYLDWIERTTGEELSDLFDAWLLSPTTPRRG